MTTQVAPAAVSTDAKVNMKDNCLQDVNLNLCSRKMIFLLDSKVKCKFLGFSLFHTIYSKVIPFNPFLDQSPFSNNSHFVSFPKTHMNYMRELSISFCFLKLPALAVAGKILQVPGIII